MEKNYILAFCPILNDKKDIEGTPYLGIGEFVQSKKFVRDGNIDTGLYGILWGKCPLKLQKHLLSLNWAVVKTELNENFIVLNKLRNEVKFKRGIILHIGKIKSCSKYLLNIKDDKSQFFHDESKQLKEEQIIGSKRWNDKLKEISWSSRLHQNKLNKKESRLFLTK